MRIISKFKDYYDIGLKYGIDPNIIYVRETKEIEIVKGVGVKATVIEKFKDDGFNSSNVLFPKWYQKNLNHIKKKYDVEGSESKYVVGFCGKVYPGINLEKSTGVHPFTKHYDCYAYNINDVIRFLKEADCKKTLDRMDKPYSAWGRRTYRMDLEDYFGYNGNRFNYLFDKYKVPCFIVGFGTSRPFHENIITLNPNLGKVEFYKVINPYTAFQTLSMYMGNFLFPPAKEMLTIKDKDMMYKKGFDDRSFKKEPKERKKI